MEGEEISGARSSSGGMRWNLPFWSEDLKMTKIRRCLRACGLVADSTNGLEDPDLVLASNSCSGAEWKDGYPFSL